MRTLFPLAALAACAAAFAAPAGVSTIQTGGEATVYGLPTHAVFWVEKVHDGADFEAAMKAAEGFGELLRAETSGFEIPPGDFNALAPALADLDARRVKAAVRMQFALGNLGGPDTANARFAKLCGQILAAAQKLEAEARGPRFEAANAEALMRQAVGEAVSNAYPAAEAASAVLGEPIFAVDRVEVLETAWNAPSEVWDNTPSLRQVAVTVKVAVTYALGPTGGL